MELTHDYYKIALDSWDEGDLKKSLFYFGAALHLVQDVTIPQHVNLRLFGDHRKYENFVKRTYDSVNEFQAYHGAYCLSSIGNYIKFNSRVALKIYKRFQSIKNEENRYYVITKCTLPLAEKTTAGAMVLFYQQTHQE